MAGRTLSQKFWTLDVVGRPKLLVGRPNKTVGRVGIPVGRPQNLVGRGKKLVGRPREAVGQGRKPVGRPRILDRRQRCSVSGQADEGFRRAGTVFRRCVVRRG